MAWLRQYNLLDFLEIFLKLPFSSLIEEYDELQDPFLREDCARQACCDVLEVINAKEFLPNTTQG